MLVAGSAGIASNRGVTRFLSTRIRGVAQSSSDQGQIGERCGDFQSLQVFCHTAVTDLAETEEVPDHAEYVFDLGVHSQHVAMLLFFGPVDGEAVAAPTVGDVLGSGRSDANNFGRALMPLITPDPRLLSRHQIGQCISDSDVLCRGEHSVHGRRFAVHANMRVHAEISLAVVRCLMRLRIRLVDFVVGPALHADDRDMEMIVTCTMVLRTSLMPPPCR